jgi:hypothetical protein
MERLAKLRALSLPECRLLAEALVALALASLVVSVFPFRVIGHWASGGSPAPALPQVRRAAISRVRWAVSACARRVPFRSKCFEQGLAALWMLRRRGVSATLHFGAAQEHESLVAHVWITADDEAVIGCEIKDRFFELVRFPQLDRPDQI